MSGNRRKGPQGRQGSSSQRDSNQRGAPKGGPAHSGPRGSGADRGREEGGRQHSRPTPARGERHRGGSNFARDAHLVWGFHSVREALRAGRRKPLRLLATQAAAEKLGPEIAASGVAVNVAPPDEIGALLPDGAVHQGVVLEAGPLPEMDLGDLQADAMILVLDQVTDPHNVGAIVRTAAAFGVKAIVTTERHSPALGGVLAKAASGGLEHVDIITVVNLARALETLGDMGFQRVGLDSDGPQSLMEMTLSRPLALVLGAEGKGLRRLSREKCDALARIDLPGAVRSLNVSNACAVALTIASMRIGRP